jgi:hypothetical protein
VYGSGTPRSPGGSRGRRRGGSGREGGQGAHGVEQGGRGAAGEVAVRAAHVWVKDAVAGKHGRADLVADVAGHVAG